MEGFLMARDLIGQIFHNLTVLERASSNRQGSRTWLCECFCGNKKVFSTDHLTRKKSPVKSCGCQMHKSGKDHHQWNGVGDISGGWWHDHVLRERTQGVRTKVPVEITKEEAWNLFLEQDRCCALTGLPLTIGTNRYNDASIDRIDSSRGYVLDNVQWVHKHVNFMKRTYSQEYFITMCRKVAEKHPEILVT